MVKIAYAALTALAATSGVSAAIEHGIECTPCAGGTNVCTIKAKVNFYAGETGYFEFEGCEGVNPTLLLNVGRTYKFDQKDNSNWYHLLGFAYEADGAHVPVDELEPGVTRGDNPCSETSTCPAPMYFQDGKYVGSYSNIAAVKEPTVNDDDFGLDVVEPLFFHPIGDWQSYGDMETYLNYDYPLTQDFFYFCHIHSGMSGRVKLIDADGNKLSVEDTPALPYEYAELDDFNEACGTFNLTDYQPEMDNNMCPSMFICPSEGQEVSQYAKCVEAMNCHMMSSMTTTAAGVLELFNHQMIPHHQNAVNMAKSFLKIHAAEAVCDGVSGIVEEGTYIPWQCDMVPIFLDIINVQNSQIVEMKEILNQLGSAEYANCDVDFSEVEVSRNRRLEKTDRRLESVYRFGVDCKPCADTTGECEVIMKINHFAGERGYYEVDGCDGVNPTLHLSINRTYKFDQSDKSNWYHLIGFAYEADGAHTGVDELEPVIAPGDSNCAETTSCPAPMYYKDGKYTGVYSNNPDLLPATTGEDDFGLDTVEPEFFHPLGEWLGYGSYETYLNFDTTYDKDIFYFCHVHSDMTGRIKLLDANGEMLSTENVPEIPYEYDIVTEYDQKCGTFGLDSFQLPNAKCPDHFVCDAGEGIVGTFGACVDSMNCAMLNGMTTTYGGDNIGSDFLNDAILFMRQMIPHHQNAVNMAKAALILGEIECSSAEPLEEGMDISVGCHLDPIVRGIINSQNKQIQTMRDILNGTFKVSEFASCGVPTKDGDGGDSSEPGSDAHAIFGGTMAALAVGAAALF